MLNREYKTKFDPVVEQVKGTFRSLRASGGAILLIHNDKVVTEEYWGTHSFEPDARNIQADSQFHVASVRKSYIGFAFAYAHFSNKISSLDDEVLNYLPSLDERTVRGTTLRHLLTHTHGLVMDNGQLKREFPAGESWAYRNIGVDLLTTIIHQTTGKTIAQILSEQVFNPLSFKETGWYASLGSKHVDVIRDPEERHWQTSESLAGDKMNMYVSAEELAYWGYFHLKQGLINERQIVPKEIIQLATTIHSPFLENQPQNGCLWFVQGNPSTRTEIGELVPTSSFQILGYTSVALLVIPQHNVVAVRMFNSFGSPDGFNYLEDIRNFGNTVMKCF